MVGMSTALLVALTVGLGRAVTDEVARDVAARWAAALRLDLGMTSTNREGCWIRVSATAAPGHAHADGRGLADHAEAELEAALRAVGSSIETWHAVEIVDDAEQARRAEHRGIPPLYNATQLAELAGISRQRVYQLESDRKAGVDNGFPAPVLEGYWLRSVGDHWAETRKRRPGPAARSAS